MATVSYASWINDGKPFVMCTPLLDLRSTLGRHGYTGPATGYPDDAHLTTDFPEDHAPFSFTPWPGSQPYPYCLAIDIMPNAGVDLVALGARLVADKMAGVPGTEPIKYINWTDSAGNCWHDSWQPDHQRYPSTDRGHIHISIRTDFVISDVMANYDPLEDPMDEEARMWLHNAVSIVTAIGQGKDEATCKYAWTGDGHNIGDTFTFDLKAYWARVAKAQAGGVPDHTHDPAPVTR